MYDHGIILVHRDLAIMLSQAAGAELERSSFVRRFPDSSLALERVEWDVSRILRLIDFVGIPIGGPTFRALHAFGGRMHNLIYDCSYQAKIGIDENFMINPGHGIPPTRDEGALAALPVGLEFHGRVTKTKMQQFAQALANWHGTVRDAGMFGEGPIPTISAEVSLTDRSARFFIDASQTGQQTINWLILSFVNFGADILPVNVIDLGNHFRRIELVPTPAGPITTVPIPAPMHQSPSLSSNVTPSELVNEVKVDGLTDCRLDTPFAWRESVTASSTAMKIHIVFDMDLTPDERNYALEGLRSWVEVAAYGGFSIEGLHDHQLSLSNERGAEMRIDWGASDPTTAMPILRNILLYLCRKGIRVDAVDID